MLHYLCIPQIIATSYKVLSCFSLITPSNVLFGILASVLLSETVSSRRPWSLLAYFVVKVASDSKSALRSFLSFFIHKNTL